MMIIETTLVLSLRGRDTRNGMIEIRQESLIALLTLKVRLAATTMPTAPGKICIRTSFGTILLPAFQVPTSEISTRGQPIAAMM